MPRPLMGKSLEADDDEDDDGVLEVIVIVAEETREQRGTEANDFAIKPIINAYNHQSNPIQSKPIQCNVIRLSIQLHS